MRLLAEAMVELSARASLVEGRDDDDGAALLPSMPLSSLFRLSSSSASRVVLTGCDDTSVAGLLYHSHLESASSGLQAIDKDAIALAATLLAQTNG